MYPPLVELPPPAPGEESEEHIVDVAPYGGGWIGALGRALLRLASLAKNESKPGPQGAPGTTGQQQAQTGPEAAGKTGQELAQTGPRAAADAAAGTTPKVSVRGEWGQDAVHPDSAIRTGLYDSETGILHVGGSQGHLPLARAAGIADKPGLGISGLEIVRRGNMILFRARSGFYFRQLTPAEQAQIAKALESEFGMPATYNPNLGPIARPGAPM